ncbi:MAG TPA: hypothetical protein VFA47_13085 [Candidatus Manganitrophaceae bacterium]|nr:hypothetical protein [Candidatus Manganitrophaceae bacterium]
MIYPEMTPKMPFRTAKPPLPLFRSIPLPGRAIPASAGLIHLTTDHEKIREWVKSRGGRPAAVAPLDESLFGCSEMGALRIAFPGRSAAGDLQEISWELFFELFDLRRLAFLYQEETAAGAQSRFNKFIKQERLPRQSELKRAA